MVISDCKSYHLRQLGNLHMFQFSNLLITIFRVYRDFLGVLSHYALTALVPWIWLCTLRCILWILNWVLLWVPFCLYTCKSCIINQNWREETLFFFEKLTRPWNKSSSYNQFHNILRLVDVLPNFLFTTSKTIGDYYL